MTHAQIETLNPEQATLTLSLDVSLYPRDVLYAAAYVFLDRAYVLLDRTGSRFIVHVRGKQPLDENALRAMAGEFENELLAQALRLKVFKANQRVIERITALAITGATGDTVEDEAPPADLDECVEDGFLDDPLHIATPWQAKRKDG